MQPVTVHCRAPEGMDAPAVSVEVYLARGLPSLSIVGLVETSVKESRDRVRAAILNSGFDMPDRRIIVSLAPADLPKHGSRYDLAIALGILCASEQLPSARLADCEFLGELSLAGELRAINGTLPSAMQALAAGHRCVVPAAGADEAGLLNDERVLCAAHLLDAARYLNGTSSLPPAETKRPSQSLAGPDMSEVEGQQQARRALEICAAGGHHLLMSGPPGTGKSMLAQRLPGLLPPPDNNEALTSAAIYSLRGEKHPGWGRRPFRAPHHTATMAALVGGTSNPRPGEISLAHTGVLFLDELPEFNRATLETLREPLETASITIARASRTLTFPARFQLVAAMNPCPCGFAGDPSRECRCSPEQIRRYRDKLSGPFMDRIDVRLQLQREQIRLRASGTSNETSAIVRRRVAKAMQIQRQRSGVLNAHLNDDALRTCCWPDDPGLRLLEEAAGHFDLSRRACYRVLRVARTIADLEASEGLSAQHVAEALALRNPQQMGAETPAGKGFQAAKSGLTSVN